MKEKIREHFNTIFAGAPKTRSALDLKQEMMQNAMDKYDDMVADGYPQEDAYQNVIESVGDVTQLFPEVEEKNLLALPEKDRKKKAMLTASAVGIYLFAAVVFFAFGMFDGIIRDPLIDTTSIGFVIAMLICIAPTIMIVYAANMYPGYSRSDRPDMVERYKEACFNSNKEKAVRKSINAIIWLVTLIAYFAISFETGDWHITWIAFLIALCIQMIVRLIFDLRADEKHL